MRTRKVHYDRPIGARTQVLDDLDAIRRAFGFRSRGEAVSAIVFVLRHLQGETVREDRISAPPRRLQIPEPKGKPKRTLHDLMRDIAAEKGIEL